MSLMGWSSAEMAARYQHVTDAIRQDVARQVDDLIWRPRGADAATVPVNRGSLAALLRLAELGVAQTDSTVTADTRAALDHIRRVLASREQPA
jgi:hypothetical protein